MIKKRPRVVLLVETSNSYCRELLRGIYAYIQENGPWSTFLTEQARGDPAPKWVLDNLQGDGIIARIENRRIAQAVMKTGLPVVDVSAARIVPEIPWVETDDAAMARSAAEHLLDRGFKHFGFVGRDQFHWSKWREEEFVRVTSQAGNTCSVFRTQPFGRRLPMNLMEEEKQLVSWIQKLPKPVGVMACYDVRGQQLLDVCRRVGVAVPDEMAVVSVDNDEMICSLSDPPLSSVIPNTHQTGYEAARMLDRLMHGKSAGKHSMKIAPLGIATRQSTDVLAVADHNISQAMHFIREHACEGIKVDDVLKAVPLSRRVLEHRFKKLLGYSPHDEILRMQFQRVVELLSETALPLATIAEHSGFRHAEYLSVAFKKRFGVTPSEYRRQHQRGNN
jgi:LacI family transcriptional regulator